MCKYPGITRRKSPKKSNMDSTLRGILIQKGYFIISKSMWSCVVLFWLAVLFCSRKSDCLDLMHQNNPIQYFEKNKLNHQSRAIQYTNNNQREQIKVSCCCNLAFHFNGIQLNPFFQFSWSLYHLNRPHGNASQNIIQDQAYIWWNDAWDTK